MLNSVSHHGVKLNVYSYQNAMPLILQQMGPFKRTKAKNEFWRPTATTSRLPCASTVSTSRERIQTVASPQSMLAQIDGGMMPGQVAMSLMTPPWEDGFLEGDPTSAAFSPLASNRGEDAANFQ
jgi:hypothetical protein